jgi:FMN phosphatase YigB (HAD superfamily)
MSIALVILDFDGTFTDAHAEAVPFLASFRGDLFALLGRDASAEWDEARELVIKNPELHGWRNGGVICAPGGADPYLQASCIAQLLCDRFGVVPDEAERAEMLQDLYRKAYALTLSVPRADARQVIEGLLERRLPVVVVTNSRADHVTRKVATLGLAADKLVPVIGDAQKFVLDTRARDDLFDGLEDMALPGLTRRVAIKRGHYYDVMKELWRQHGARPETTMVCGDIFELDLALPLALGSYVHLIHRHETPPYEVSFVNGHPRGAASQELSGLLARLDGLDTERPQ